MERVSRRWYGQSGQKTDKAYTEGGMDKLSKTWIRPSGQKVLRTEWAEDDQQEWTGDMDRVGKR